MRGALDEADAIAVFSAISLISYVGEEVANEKNTVVLKLQVDCKRIGKEDMENEKGEYSTLESSNQAPSVMLLHLYPPSLSDTIWTGFICSSSC